ncbi:MAG: type II toxin-antitoxin system antitoxin DNA ADP-ribosyl glycohydrolase DarG [Flavobacterium sp.]
MIHYRVGNILESEAEAFINTVNTDGIMGKGIALQFKNAFPLNFKIYQEACKNESLKVGNLLLVEDTGLISGKKTIINFPTKTTWRKPSEYQYINDGLDELIRVIDEKNIKSVAIPPLGSGNGGLDWNIVKKMIEERLSHLTADILIYEPNKQIQEVLKSERVKLTEARAMLLFMLYELVKNGEFVSEFSSEKICYFLQRFGGEKYFKLEYKPNFYGPYSGKVKYVINYLNGSYIMGYSAMDKKPFEPLELIPDGYEPVLDYINSKPEIKKIVLKTKEFLDGFYSEFALELLSTIDYISIKKESFDVNVIKNELENWSERKRTLFSNDKFLKVSLKHLQQHFS